MKRLSFWVMTVTFVVAGGVLFRGQSPPDSMEHRVTALETRLDSIESIGKGLLVMIGGQLLLQGLNLRQRKTGFGGEGGFIRLSGKPPDPA